MIKATITVVGTVVVLLLCALALKVQGGDVVQPVLVTWTNARDISGNTYVTANGTCWEGSTVRFTNVLYLVGDEDSNTQGLDGVSITYTVGNANTNCDYSGFAISTNGGLGGCDEVTVPSDMNNCTIQSTLVDENGTTGIWDWVYMVIQEAL